MELRYLGITRLCASSSALDGEVFLAPVLEGTPDEHIVGGSCVGKVSGGKVDVLKINACTDGHSNCSRLRGHYVRSSFRASFAQFLLQQSGAQF